MTINNNEIIVIKKTNREKHSPYLDEDESWAVNDTGPGGSCLVDKDIPLGATRLVAVLGVLVILKEGTLLAGVVLIRLKNEIIIPIMFDKNTKQLN